MQVLEGALPQHNSALYSSRILGPHSRYGDVLMLDNLRVHQLSGLREWLAGRGVEVLYLPPYFPNFISIEQAWSKLRTVLRQAQALTQLALQEALQVATPWITQADARNRFHHCGYYVHRS
jgi:transposase